MSLHEYQHLHGELKKGIKNHGYPTVDIWISMYGYAMNSWARVGHDVGSNKVSSIFQKQNKRGKVNENKKL